MASFAFLLLGTVSWMLKTLMDYSVIRLGTKIFQQENLLNRFFSAAIMHIPLIVMAVIFGTFGQFVWKDQRVEKTAC